MNPDQLKMLAGMVASGLIAVKHQSPPEVARESLEIALEIDRQANILLHVQTQPMTTGTATEPQTGKRKTANQVNG